MRNFHFILIAALYFMLSAGVHLQLRYCCGEMVGINFVEWSSCCSPGDGPDRLCTSGHDGCCETADYFIHLSDDQKPTTGIALLFGTWLTESQQVQEIASIPEIPDLRIFRAGDSSPPGPPLFKKHCQFVFYD